MQEMVDSKLLSKTMSKQHSIQTKLYKLITSLHIESSEDIKEIPL